MPPALPSTTSSHTSLPWSSLQIAVKGEMLAVVALAAVWTLHGALAWVPSVHYFPIDAWGVHLLALGRTLSSQDAYTNITVRSACKCKLACKSDDRCVAASIGKSVSREMFCLLSSKGPTETNVTIGNETNYFYWFDSLPATDFGVKEDGLLYLMGKLYLNFADAQRWCNKIPGYRLAIFKIPIQYPMVLQMVKDTGKRLWLDLKLNGQQLVWGDGTHFEETPFSQAARVTLDNNGLYPVAVRAKLTELNDRNVAYRTRPLCQANPRGIPW